MYFVVRPLDSIALIAMNRVQVVFGSIIVHHLFHPGAPKISCQLFAVYRRSDNQSLDFQSHPAWGVSVELAPIFCASAYPARQPEKFSRLLILSAPDVEDVVCRSCCPNMSTILKLNRICLLSHLPIPDWPTYCGDLSRCLRYTLLRPPPGLVASAFR